MIANGCFLEVEGCGGIRTIDNPIQIEGTEKVRPQKPPAIGGDSMSELKSIGYSDEEVREMVAAGVVGMPG